jgi:predicted RNA binding protein YcfA (HicA-like mRNA interferase family)
MKYKELFRILKKAGWIIVRISGSHCILEHPDINGKIIIPFHSGKEVKKGLLQSIIKQTGIRTNKR